MRFCHASTFSSHAKDPSSATRIRCARGNQIVKDDGWLRISQGMSAQGKHNYQSQSIETGVVGCKANDGKEDSPSTPSIVAPEWLEGMKLY